MKVIKYITASGNSYSELDGAVEGFINEGFQPFGSPYSASKEDNPAFFQAMVKYESKATVAAVG